MQFAGTDKASRDDFALDDCTVAVATAGSSHSPGSETRRLLLFPIELLVPSAGGTGTGTAKSRRLPIRDPSQSPYSHPSEASSGKHAAFP